MNSPNSVAPPIPCPLRDGCHIWIWPGGHNEGWLTAHAQATRALALGCTGVIVQAGLSAPVWLEGRDAGDAVCRGEVFMQAGLQVTAGLGMDAGAATEGLIVDAILRALTCPAECVMADWELPKKWETPEGRALAKRIVDRVLLANSIAAMRCVMCPWWKPEVHSGAPYETLFALFRFLFVQAYGAPAQGNPTECSVWMLDHARAIYPTRFNIPARNVLPADQMYGHTLANAGKLLFNDEPVIALWDVEEADAVFLTAMKARKAIAALGIPTTAAGLVQFERAHNLGVDAGVLGPEIVRALAL